MKVVYIAHPISGDILGNLERIKNIVRRLNLAFPDLVPFAPYWLDCHALDDNNPLERARGIRNDQELFRRKFIDELWLWGDRISDGMMAEIKLANELRIPVVPQTASTLEAYQSIPIVKTLRYGGIK
jgi:hypothetical protein